jgi:hypothetical protein
VLGSSKYSKPYLVAFEQKRSTFEKWKIVANKKIGDDDVLSMYIISTHFEGVECQLKLLFLTPTNYTIVYIQVEIHAKEIRTTTEVLTIKPLELQNPLKKCLTCA